MEATKEFVVLVCVPEEDDFQALKAFLQKDKAIEFAKEEAKKRDPDYYEDKTSDDCIAEFWIYGGEGVVKVQEIELIE